MIKVWKDQKVQFDKLISPLITHQIFPLACDWWNHDTWPNNVPSNITGHYQPIMSAHSQYLLSGEQISKWSSGRKYQEVNVFCCDISWWYCKSTVWKCHTLLLSLWEEILKDNKDKVLLASEICTNSCPWTLPVPRSPCSLLGTDKILGHQSLHISLPKGLYCLHVRGDNLIFIW